MRINYDYFDLLKNKSSQPPNPNSICLYYIFYLYIQNGLLCSSTKEEKASSPIKIIKRLSCQPNIGFEVSKSAGNHVAEIGGKDKQKAIKENNH